MLIEAYSYRDIQMFGQLLSAASEERLTVEQLSITVSSALAARLTDISAVVPDPQSLPNRCPTVRPDGSKCPGRLVPARNDAGQPLIDGLTIFGCPVCRYSEVS